ncbi:MAG: hypothetical protein F9K30_03170 [Dechloromonas sp.]|nr:MAG: hypothetical protein F9K30_03170 [Dechloromonas sp.]
MKNEDRSGLRFFLPRSTVRIRSASAVTRLGGTSRQALLDQASGGIDNAGKAQVLKITSFTERGRSL